MLKRIRWCLLAALGWSCVAWSAAINPSQIAQNDAPPAPAVAAASASAAKASAPILVLNSLSASVSVVDPQRWVEVKRVPTGKEPHHLYLTPDEKSVIVANAVGNSLTFLDPRTGDVQRTVHSISDPYHLRFSPDMKWLVTAGNRLNHIDIYRWNAGEITLAQRVATGKTPSHLWIDSKSTVVYGTMQESDELVAIDLATQTIKWRIKTGFLPADIFGTPDDKKLLVALTGARGVEVYDVSEAKPLFVKTLTTASGAHAFRSLGDKQHIFVSNRAANSISKIDYQSMEVVDTFDVPSGPDCMDLSADGRYLYVGSRWANKLTVVDLSTRTVVRQVKVGKSPHGVWTLDHKPR